MAAAENLLDVYASCTHQSTSKHQSGIDFKWANCLSAIILYDRKFPMTGSDRKLQAVTGRALNND